MKKSIALVASLASIGMLTASTIDWELPNLVDGNDAALSPTYEDIFFIYNDATAMSYDSESGIITVTDNTQVKSGHNTLNDTDPLSGTWEDGNDKAGTYYMAYYSGGTYYAISDGAGGVATVAVSATGGEPLIPGGTTSGSTFDSKTFSDSVWSSGSVRTVSPSVPEPATAALAVAGIAMLIRRRRQA